VQHHTGAEYERAEFLTDHSLFDQGKDLVTHYGCFGCHEIAGTEGLGKVATDLSSHGSKPIERLDFALLAKQAKRDGWYHHQGFLDAKLADPPRFDQGKIRHDWRERLKMPDFDLSDEDRRALVTFLLGSVDSQLPEAFYHRPTSWAKDIEQGWWVVKKYNCQSCHQIVPEETPDVWALPQYQGEGREMAPPSLVGSGARFEEGWLARFLRNPSLHRTEQDRNGARAYLDIRMPTYALSEEEIGQLVRFFNALSEQPSPYPEEKLEPLNEDELADVRALFRAGQCLSCHVTSDDPRTFTSQTKAPSYLVSAERLKPDWNRRWLRDPGQIMPGTVMPTFFTEIDGRWRATVLSEDQLRVPEADQVELMVRYQKFFDEAEAEYWAEQAEQ
jgi:mono/diheme cytochrome c family protein